MAQADEAFAPVTVLICWPSRPSARSRRRETRHIVAKHVTLRSGTELAVQGIATMTRFLIFAAMAPPLGFVVAFWVMLQIANWLAGSPITFDVAQIMMLPTIYLVGVIPALLAAWFDHAWQSATSRTASRSPRCSATRSPTCRWQSRSG
jgi:hypothetical protein